MFRVCRVAVVLFVAFALQACTLRGGGMLGSVENGRLLVVNLSRDRALPPVATPAMNALRMYATQTAIMRIAERVPARANDRNSFAIYQKTANDRLSDLIYCIYAGTREADADDASGQDICTRRCPRPAFSSTL